MFIPVSDRERQEFLCRNERKFIPGYTGHCPNIKFHFGKSYGADTKEILEELRDHNAIRDIYTKRYREEDYSKDVLKFTERQRQYRKRKDEEEKRIRARSAPRLTPIRSEDQVDRMVKEYEARITYKEKELSPECPPISGYTGHIPRVKASEESLSQRYSTAVRKSLERLREERKRQHYFKGIQDDIDRAIKGLDKQCLKDD
ncbi:LOW QUALITY PROTEIN: uncharacterized protein C10orf82 homolog [Agrilus planipennis]|uniref:LOW QUALITY PROTEIN: uncharacterized protein C10orf82 homolog n=1 Tax=Agrilus planipennis TaxID=224129 RepID=A0A7F5RDC0_AGRPL|nr:LOW QUALITY PROTEIN: uncharacterized protein C10orf82 homolog [Agrilus planipennis]